MSNNPPRGLGVAAWEPYRHFDFESVLRTAYRRADGAGYVIEEPDGRWWVTWAHPMILGKPGWHHDAFGTYGCASSAALAFDKVYELEKIAGNSDRCPELRKPLS